MELHVAFTHLIVGSDDEVLLGHWGVPGHAARDSTLLDAIGAGQNNSVFLRLLQVILHLMEKVVPIYVCFNLQRSSATFCEDRGRVTN